MQIFNRKSVRQIIGLTTAIIRYDLLTDCFMCLFIVWSEIFQNYNIVVNSYSRLVCDWSNVQMNIHQLLEAPKECIPGR